MSVKSANGVSAGTRTKRGTEGSSGSRQETPNKRSASHRRPVAVLFKPKGRI